MTFLYALATLWPKLKPTKYGYTQKLSRPTTQGHTLVYFRQALLLPLFCFIISVDAQAQSAGEKTDGIKEIKPFIAGQKLPVEFWTKRHLFYVNGDTVRKTLEEYKGKLLVLDFWATWCGACRVNFPKLEILKQKFGSEVSFILVNPLRHNDTIEKIKKAYHDFELSGGSNLPSIVLDEYIVAHFPHLGIPRYIWINPKGRFIATTGNLFVDAEQITKILEGKY